MAGLSAMRAHGQGTAPLGKQLTVERDVRLLLLLLLHELAALGAIETWNAAAAAWPRVTSPTLDSAGRTELDTQ